MVATQLPAASPAPATGQSTWLAIPGFAGTLLWRHWPELLFWFFVQWVAYGLLMDGAIWLAGHSLLLGYGGLSVLIVVQLACSIAMFLALRPSLGNVAAALPAMRGQTPGWNHALAVAMLPFFAYYATWGLLDGIKRDFRMDYIDSTTFRAREELGNVLALDGLWIALLVAAVLRYIAKRLSAGSEHKLHWSLLMATCEAYWMFIGVSAIGRGIAGVRQAWSETVAYAALTGWWESPFVFTFSLEPVKRIVAPLWMFVSSAAGGMLMPLIWLAITAIVYGMDLRRRQRIDNADAHLGLLGRRFRNAPYLLRFLAGKLSAGWTSKGVPVVNSIRLVLRAGLPALLTLAVLWQALAFVDAWSWRAMVRLLGPRDWLEWQALAQPFSILFENPEAVRSGLLTTLLRMVLLAATLDVALSRLRRRAR